MNAIQKLFSPQGRMQATAERTADDLRLRLAEIEAEIPNEVSTEKIAALLEEKESVQRQIEAARIAKEKQTRETHRAKVNAAREAYIAEVQAEVAELWKTLPRVRWALFKLERLEVNGVAGFDGKNFDEVSGLPAGFTGRISQLLAQELRGTTLGEQIGPAGTESEPVIRKRAEERMILPPAYVTDALGNSLASKRIG